MVCNVLCNTGGTQVNRGTISDSGILIASDLHKLLLPEFITSELGTTLNEIADGSGAEACKKGSRTLISNNVACSGKEVEPFECRINLDACLDDINC